MSAMSISNKEPSSNTILIAKVKKAWKLLSEGVNFEKSAVYFTLNPRSAVCFVCNFLKTT